MLDKKVVELLNQQVNKEFYSAYLYLDFSGLCYDQGLDGAGSGRAGSCHALCTVSAE